MSVSTRHAWAVKSAAWRVFNAFAGLPVREETFSNALRLELMALLPSSVVTREMPVPLTFTPSNATRPIACGHGRADVFIQTALPSDDAPYCTVVEVKRERAGTGYAQARMYRRFLDARDAYLVVFTSSMPVVTTVR
jgi:hypothetical protein